MKCYQICAIFTLCQKPLKVRLLIFLNCHLPRRVGLTTLKSYFSCTFKITIILRSILFHLQSMELPQTITKTGGHKSITHHRALSFSSDFHLFSFFFLYLSSFIILFYYYYIFGFYWVLLF